jgi:hypothetical protein
MAVLKLTLFGVEGFVDGGADHVLNADKALESGVS